jgi:alpha-tubulin suppressor-like RCC1 family protein
VTVGSGIWRDVAVTYTHACALDQNGRAWCWGTNTWGLGDGSIMRLVPTQISTRQFTSLDCGSAHTVAIEAGTNLLWCWGTNDQGVCGTGDETDSAVPRQVGTLLWSSVSAGWLHTCGRNSMGAACWGDNTYGQVGNGGATPYETSPFQFQIPAELAQGSPQSGVQHACGLSSSGKLWCWGYNGYSQLGVPSTNSLEPAPVAVAGTWRAVAPGFHHTCAIAADGSLWCWGINYAGQLGDAEVSYASMPHQISTEQWTSLNSGSTHSCAIRADQSLWCWGANDRGQLGIGSTPPNGTPRLIR